jgi:ribonuclease HI
MTAKKLIIYSDGASRGNPGPAGIGTVICDESGAVIKEYGDFIGEATNNVAEYQALLKALELASSFSSGEVDCFLDSELVVKQLNGEYRVKNEKLKLLFRRVREKEKNFERVNYSHVPREEAHLKRADKLANLAIDDEFERRKERRENGWNYFGRGKELFSKYRDDLSAKHVEEIEMSFRKAIELNSELWAPHYYLGLLFNLIKRYSEAKIEFEKSLQKNPGPRYEQAIRYCLEEIKRIESGYSFPRNLEEVMKMTSDPILLNHALIEWFENTLRELIQEVLSREYREEWWWEGVPSDVRKKYGERVQETRLKEERGLPELYFIDFYDYGKVVEANKGIFSSYMENPKEWRKRLDNLESIRNSIMHCRGQYLSEERFSILKESCAELQKLAKKVNEETR